MEGFGSVGTARLVVTSG